MGFNLKEYNMSLAFYTILVATVMYFLSAFSCVRDKDWSHAGMWVSYASANFFLMLYEFQKLNNK